MDRFKGLACSPLGGLCILTVAAAVRLYKLPDWSLWEDEGTSLFFATHPGSTFSSYFPIFFWLLHGLFALGGDRILLGRLLAAFFGLLSIGLAYVYVRRRLSPAVAILTAGFLALNLGHVFWSQSIRYYTLVLVFQLLCMFWFLRGFERHDWRALLLSNLALGLALLTHFSAVLLVPALVGYLLLLALRPEGWQKPHLKSCLVFGGPCVMILAWFVWRFLEFRRLGLIEDNSSVPVGGQDPVAFSVRVGVYFGLPLIVLGLAVPLVARRFPVKPVLFFLVAGVVPLLELLVITQLRLALVAWYYALFAAVALTVLASMTLVGLYQQGWRRTALGACAAVALWQVSMLGGYYTVMHGDRPRWKEAADFLVQTADVRAGARENPEIFATVPPVVAFYLGVEPGEILGNPLVKGMPPHPPEQLTLKDQWFIVEAGCVSAEYDRWFANHCELTRTFTAQSGPKDRTIRVYHYPAGARHSALP